MRINTATVVSLCVPLLIFSTAAIGDGVIEGQKTWEEGNGHSYVIVRYPEQTWLAASDDVAIILPGYHLVTVTNQAEQDFVWQFLVETVDYGSEWWLGGFQDVEVETDPAEGWEWVTGELWDYTNWADGEPNDGGGIEDHLALERGRGGQWNDEGTAIGLIAGYIAERSEDLPVVIELDIRPFCPANLIDPNSRRDIWVAALSDTDFDPLQINILSVRFGPDEAQVRSQRVWDANRDGLGDLVLRFRIPETGIQCGDTEATLTGETFDRQMFTGTDSIRTVGCP